MWKFAPLFFYLLTYSRPIFFIVILIGYLVNFEGSSSNGGSESNYSSGGQASVIVPFVTSYPPFVSAASSNGASEQLASLQPSSIKRTYPPASSSPAPTNAGSGIIGSNHDGGEKKIKLDAGEESEK